MASPTLKFKRGAFANLPTLAVGEPGFTTDRYQLFVGSLDGNQLIGDGDFFNINTTTEGGGVRLFEATNNGTEFIELAAPATIGAAVTYTFPVTDGSANQLLQTNGSGTLSFGDVNVSNIDIDGATDIGAAIVDADLFIVDDGATGTNRKTTASRLKSYVLGGGGGGSSFDSVVVGSAVTINLGGIDAGQSGIITAGGGFVGNLTGDVTGNADTATTSTNFTVTANNTTDETVFPVFVDGATGTQGAETDTGLNYNPSTGNLVSTRFTGNVVGNVTGDVTGTASTATLATNAQGLTGTPDITVRNIVGAALTVNGNIVVTGTVDGRDVLDDGQAGDNLVTLSGVARDATNLGTFTGSIIADSETVKGALQDLETELESVAGGGASAATVAVGQTDVASTHFITFVSDNNTSPTQESIRTGAGISFNPSTNALTVAGNIKANGNIVGDNSTNISGISSVTATTFVGDLEGTADLADKLSVTNVSTTDTNFTLTMTDGSNTSVGRAFGIDNGLTYNPSSNQINVGTVDATNATIDNLTFTSGTAITSVDTDISSVSGSDDTVASSKAIKTYVDSSVSGVAVTFGVAADSGTTDIFQTGQTLTLSGTTNEVDTAVNASTNTVTFGLPATVTITTELNVPTVDVGALRASDGTAAQTISDSTGKVTTSTDHEVQGQFTAAGAAVLQGNVDIGNQSTDTVTVTGRFDSNLLPIADRTSDLGATSLNWDEGHIRQVKGISANLSGVATAAQFKGTSLEMTGNGTFGGNVEITGNLAVGGSVTSIDVEDLRIVSPVVELGLQRLADGSLQPPANVTNTNAGIIAYYNHVGINSTNAQKAAVFFKIKNGGDMRIGFATDVVVNTTGAGASVASVNHWADIEAKGLWIRDCAGSSQVISCTGSTRFLENITVDGGSFT